MKTIAAIAVFSVAVAIVEANSESLNLKLSGIFRQGPAGKGPAPVIRPGATPWPSEHSGLLSFRDLLYVFLFEAKPNDRPSFVPASLGVSMHWHSPDGFQECFFYRIFIPAFLFLGNKKYRKTIAVFIVFSTVCIFAFGPSASRIANTLKLLEDGGATSPLKSPENDGAPSPVAPREKR